MASWRPHSKVNATLQHLGPYGSGPLNFDCNAHDRLSTSMPRNGIEYQSGFSNLEAAVSNGGTLIARGVPADRHLENPGGGPS
jgi:hypothetical protein